MLSDTAIKFIFALIFVAVGVLSIIFPEYAWYLAHGIWDKNAEPTDASGVIIRIGGVIIAAVGIFYGISVLNG